MIAEYFAGVAGGVAVVLVGHPFDTTKTRLQTAPPGYYSSTWDCVRKTWKISGFRGFYAGMTSPLVGQMFFRAVSFTTFHTAVTVFNCKKSTHHEDANSFELLKAGAITGLVIAFVETPIDLLKTKLQIQIFGSQLNPNFIKPSYTTMTSCIIHLTNQHGVISLWQGLTATIVRNVPANALFFPVNELVKRMIVEHNHLQSTKELNIWHKLLAGGCAGLGYWVGLYPLDVIKARIQSLDYESIQIRKKNSLSLWLETAKMIYQKDGIRGFSIGLLPCALRAIPACSVMFATADVVRQQIEQILN